MKVLVRSLIRRLYSTTTSPALRCTYEQGHDSLSAMYLKSHSTVLCSYIFVDSGDISITSPVNALRTSKRRRFIAYRVPSQPEPKWLQSRTWVFHGGSYSPGCRFNLSSMFYDFQHYLLSIMSVIRIRNMRFTSKGFEQHAEVEKEKEKTMFQDRA